MVNILVIVHSHFHYFSLYIRNFYLSSPRLRFGEERLI